MTVRNPDQIEAIRLFPDKLMPIFVLCFSTFFLLAGLNLAFQGVLQGWYLVSLFGLAIVASGSAVLPGSSFLEIDGRGLKIVSRYRETFYAWSQIERIGIFEIGIVKRIGIDLNDSFKGPQRVPEYMKSASGYHVTLPHVTAMELENLLEVLLKIREVTQTSDRSHV